MANPMICVLARQLEAEARLIAQCSDDILRLGMEDSGESESVMELIKANQIDGLEHAQRLVISITEQLSDNFAVLNSEKREVGKPPLGGDE